VEEWQLMLSHYCAALAVCEDPSSSLLARLRLQHVARPGGLPFVLFMLLVAVLAVRELLLRIETKRILREHNCGAEARAAAPKDREHAD